MVDENMVRKDIVFAETAHLAMHCAMDWQSFEHDPDQAVSILFKSAVNQKQSYIRNFISPVKSLGEVLIYPQEILRALGLSLA